QAAVGVAQMERLDEIIEKRQAVAEYYFDRLRGVPQLVLPTIQSASVMSWFVFVVRLVAGWDVMERDRIIASLRRHDIGCAAYFPCIHLQTPYRKSFGFREGSFPIAESVAGRTIALPFHANLTRRDVDLVAQTLEVMLAREDISRQ
ncbi:MAG: DegT/DnrJ/EryC1/StrS family aminotransferase, partial [Planctomycetota bacterium]